VEVSRRIQARRSREDEDSMEEEENDSGGFVRQRRDG
jgi:hypothetical protein